MPDPTSPLVIGTDEAPFLGFSDNVPSKIGNTQASVLADGYVRNNKIVRRKGTAPVNGQALLPAADVDGLHWAKINGTPHLVLAFGGGLYDAFNPSPASPTTPQLIPGSAGRLTPGVDANFAWVAGNSYGGDGIRPNVRLNGVNVTQAMVDRPASGMVPVDNGLAGNLVGTYAWKVAFINADGIVGEPSDFTPSLTFPGPTGRQVQLNGVPLCPAGEDCTGRAIYRFGGTAAITQFVANIPDNTTTVFYDNFADDQLGAALLVSNSRMPPFRYCCEWQSRLVGAGCTTAEADLQTVLISNVRQPYYCPLLPDTNDSNQGTRLPLQDPAQGAITGLHVHGTELVVFTGGAVFTVSGTQPLDYQLAKLFSKGCVSHRTIQSIHDLLIWLGADGVYCWVGGDRVERISDQLYNTFAGISAGDLAQSWSLVYDNRYYVGGPWGCVYLDLGTRFLPGYAAAIYLDTGKWPWGTLTNWNWRVAVNSVFTSDAKERPFGAQLGHGRVWEMETGSDDNGTPITLHWASKDLNFGQPGKLKRLQYYGTLWKAAAGIATLNLYRGTGDLIQTTTFDLTAGVEPAGMVRASYLGNPTAVRQLDQCVAEAEDEFFKLDISISSTAPTVELLQVDLHYTPAT